MCPIDVYPSFYSFQSIKLNTALPRLFNFCYCRNLWSPSFDCEIRILEWDWWGNSSFRSEVSRERLRHEENKTCSGSRVWGRTSRFSIFFIGTSFGHTHSRERTSRHFSFLHLAHTVPQSWRWCLHSILRHPSQPKRPKHWLYLTFHFRHIE